MAQHATERRDSTRPDCTQRLDRTGLHMTGLDTT